MTEIIALIYSLLFWHFFSSFEKGDKVLSFLSFFLFESLRVKEMCETSALIETWKSLLIGAASSQSNIRDASAPSATSWWASMINETYFSVMFHRTRLPTSSLPFLFSFLFSHFLSASAGWRRYRLVRKTGSRTGSRCPCPPPLAPVCRCRTCPPPQNTSSASWLRIKSEQDPSVKSSLHKL